MKRALLFSSIGIVGVAVGTGAVIQAADRSLPPSATIAGGAGDVKVGGLKQDEAAAKLREWWSARKAEPIALTVKGKTVAKTTAAEMGIQLDEAATLAGVPQEGRLTQAIGSASANASDGAATAYPPKFKTVPVDLVPLRKKVEAALPKPAPARVKFVGGKIVRAKESPRRTLDADAVQGAVLKALETRPAPLGASPAPQPVPARAEGGARPPETPTAPATAATNASGTKETTSKTGARTGAGSVAVKVELPLKEAPKRVTDETLAGITDVLATYSTNFSSGNRPRASNIRLAASKLDGVLLMPGEKASFNGTVGRRTLRGGFKTAGVYVNGKHDTGVGGGICQVSTTLYNAALLSNLKILQRSNHSLPVPYVPLGRDATVDYGNLDLVLQNTTPDPIVLTSHYTPGRLTFRVLGHKRDKVSVRIVQTGVSHGGTRERRIIDRSLAPGRSRVVEGGSGRIVASTMRIVKKNGMVVARERLGTSYYGGGTRVVAYNPARPRSRAPRRAPASAPARVAPSAPSAPAGDPSELPL